MSEQSEVVILMAVYNGEKYLKEQIDSILNQTYQNWQLVIRDDQSTDGSKSILLGYVQFDPRITLISYGSLHGSACHNFSDLSSWALANCSCPVMYADQDDIWEADKVEISMAELAIMELEFGSETPLLCYSNFQFIDEKGVEITQHLYLPEKLKLNVLLTENHAWGCTMILNQALLKLVVPIPADAVNHDYWIALIASALGQTKLIARSLIKYRQHSLNVSGNVNNMSFINRLKRYVINQRAMLQPLSANLRTVQYFYDRLGNTLSGEKKTIVANFLSSYERGFVSLLFTLNQHKIYKIGLAKNVVYWYTLFLLRDQVIAKSKASAYNEGTLR